VRIGESSGTNHFHVIDNVFIGNSYDDIDLIAANMNITSYSQWSAGSNPSAITTNMRLIWRSLP
jgi:hypothetical protein